MKQAGFSLVELIAVMVVIGILAVVALPRFDRSEMDRRAFHDETMAALRYAQKTAIASRRNVCVVFPGTTSLTLQIAATFGPNVSCLGTNLTGPQGTSPFTVTARGVAVYSATPAFQFDALGRPFTTPPGLTSVGQTITVTSSGVSIFIVADTGYVHE
jgi:MSHA pilin protein MshC